MKWSNYKYKENIRMIKSHCGLVFYEYYDQIDKIQKGAVVLNDIIIEKGHNIKFLSETLFEKIKEGIKNNWILCEKSMPEDTNFCEWYDDEFLRFTTCKCTLEDIFGLRFVRDINRCLNKKNNTEWKWDNSIGDSKVIAWTPIYDIPLEKEVDVK